jgi:hypothetical protein
MGKPGSARLSRFSQLPAVTAFGELRIKASSQKVIPAERDGSGRRAIDAAIAMIVRSRGTPLIPSSIVHCRVFLEVDVLVISRSATLSVVLAAFPDVLWQRRV